MSDVVFNGSRTRQPVDQASIELVFEDVSVPQFPDHSEIAVKRQLSRNGQSVYFLNNVRCRRKDITYLFLVTGLGPRSYAVIEQGMISRLIEAKPDELRVFLEEAAAISKYKERRKETEQRLDKTRENLDRIDDIRGELAKQLNKLKRQAKQADKFYDIESEINRLEQTIEHTNQRHKQLEDDLEQLEIKWAETEQTLQSDQKQITELETQIATTEADLTVKQEAETLTVQTLREAEEQLQEWQLNWDHFNQRAAEPTQTAQVERARMQNLEKAVNEIETEIAKLNTVLIEAETLLTNHQETVLDLRETIQEQSTELDQHQLQIHKLNGRLASLQVELAWERAVEVVLGERLQALCVSNLNDLDLENPPPGNLAAFYKNIRLIVTPLGFLSLYLIVLSLVVLIDVFGSIFHKHG